MSSTVHPMAQQGFGVGTNELYDKARPSYPSDTLTKLHSSLSQQSNLNILELGSGTGIFTRALLSHPSLSSSVASLKAVEPSAGMRDAFNKGVSDPRVTCSEGTFEKTGVEDGWADLVVVAQAWHWCPDQDRAMTEIARVLKPTGIASFIWNLEDRTSAPWLAACRDVYEAYESGTPQFRLGLWRNTFTQPSYLALYRPQEEYEFTQILPTTAEGVENRFLSKSYIAVLGEEEKSKVKGKVRGILEGERNDLRWIDREKGVFEFPYRTTLIVMRRK